MVTGISAGPWGYSPQNIARMGNPLNPRLTYQLGMTSYPPYFDGNTYVSPLIAANANWYNSFGKNKFGNCTNYTREQCIYFLNSNKKINPVTGSKLTTRSRAYKALMVQCAQYQLPCGQQQQPQPCQSVARSFRQQPSPCGQQSCKVAYSNRPAEYSNLYSKFQVVYNDCNNRDYRNKKLVLNGKVFTRGTPAYFDAQKTPGAVVTGMGCKQVTMMTRDNYQKHVNLGKFFEYNF